MDKIVEPLVPSYVNIQTCGYMPLDVNRLKGSEFLADASAEEFRAGILLWCNAWHQVPAASLPDNDKALASMAGYGRDVGSWLKVREQALRGFKRCESDGRLYHPLIAEKAIKAYGDLTVAEETGRAGGIKSGESRRRKRDDGQPTLFDETKGPSNPPSKGPSLENEGALNQMNEGMSEENEGREERDTRAPRAVELSVMFNKFWTRYPHKIGKHGDKGARRSFDRVMKSGKVSLDTIMAALDKYIATKPADRPWCNPATWLNQGRWEDEPAAGGTAVPVDASGAVKRAYAECVHGEVITEAMAPKGTVRARHVGRIHLKKETDEWSAWGFYYNEAARAKGTVAQAVPYHLDGGWSFPGRWPPGDKRGEVKAVN